MNASVPAVETRQRADVPSNVIELERLSLTVDRKSGEPLEILRDVTLEIGQGEFVCVVGPSGCGKSTILNAVAGISLAGRWSGGVRVYGEESRTFDSRIGYMVQHDTLLPWRTARENVALGGQLSGRSGVDADKLLAQVGLGGFEKSYPHQLSGGMRKRAQLARILAQNTSTILMDEPFGALDYLTKIEMQQLLLQQVGEEKSVLFVTHDLTEAITLADRIIVIGPRPGTVVDVVPVNLPRPRRHDEVIDDPQFRILYDRLWSQLKH